MNSRTTASITCHVNRAKGNSGPSERNEPKPGSFMNSIFLFRDKKTGKCTYMVTMRHLRVTIVAVEMSITQTKWDFFFHCCTLHVASIISLLLQPMHTHNIYTLKALKFTLTL